MNKNTESAFGYVRVSTRDQHEDRQIICMKQLGIPAEHILVDKQTGKDFDRPQYQLLLRHLQPGSVLYIKSIDRLGRNYEELIEQWRYITKEIGADIVVIDMPLLDTRRDKNLLGTLISDIVMALLSYVAENERDNIRQRQAEGIAAAKERGVRFGRPEIALTDSFLHACSLYRSRQLSASAAATFCGMSRSTFYRKLNDPVNR